jgi:hypothetical protein
VRARDQRTSDAAHASAIRNGEEKTHIYDNRIYRQSSAVGHTRNMSKVKSASEKKRLSLAKDRRNVYGECPTSSRKSIRRGKQRSHMESRRAVNEELRSLRGTAEDFDVDEVAGQAKDRATLLSRTAFKKVPDAPLGHVVSRKLARRAQGLKGRKSL